MKHIQTDSVKDTVEITETHDIKVVCVCERGLRQQIWLTDWLI